MSVRDQRTAPFCWQSVHALAHLRSNWSPEASAGLQAGLLVYYALTEIANEQRSRAEVGVDSSGFTAARRYVAARAGVSDRSVDRATVELERLGLLSIERNGIRRKPNRYTLLEPELVAQGNDVRMSEGSQQANDVRMSGEPTSLVPRLTSEPSSHNVKKNGQEEKNPHSPTELPSVDRKRVDPDHWRLAAAIIEAFNALAGTRYTVQAHYRPIVMRIREHPELSADDHGAIMAAAFADPWWERPGRNDRPGPEVVYGKQAQFERSIETWRASAGSTSPAAPRRVRL